jgi:propanol-preferring alcohol dehydrogenase
MALTMNYALSRQLGGPLEFACDAIPKPGRGEVLIRVAACGVCHSDVHIVDGDWGVPPKFPLVPGHEVIGEVIAIGEEAGEIPLGALVGVAWNGGACGHCRACLEGKETICPKTEGTGFGRDGGYTEYMVARSDFVIILPKTIDVARFAPVLCAGVTTYRGLKKAEIPPGGHVAIIGCGGLGQMAVQYAVAMGFSAIAVDLNPDKLAAAEKLGAVASIRADAPDVPTALREVAGPGGLRAALVLAPVASAFTQAIDAISPGGAVVFIALPKHGHDVVPISITAMIAREKRLIGSSVGARADLLEAVELAIAKNILADVETMPLSAANEALDRLRSGQVSGRLVLAMS